MSEEQFLEALESHFSLRSFRPGQLEVIQSVASGKDTLVVMPTGGGKSLCYQLPAMVREGVTLVISPLIALMKDQVDALIARGLPATFINSSLSAGEQSRRISDMAAERYKLVYVAPERFRHRRFVEELSRMKVSFVAVDEAHCVSQWGHDFRPDYLRVGEALEWIGSPPVSAFTATATPDVQADIRKFLRLREPNIYVRGFARANLSFSVVATAKRADKFARLSRLIGTEAKGIIYCATRKRVEEVAEHLNEWSIPHVAYHGGLDDGERNRLQDQFMSGEVEVAVATNAFGMGIDRSDLRFIVHFEMPGSVEAYYQEAGRAGRDGLPSTCVLFYNYADRRTQDFFIDGANPSAEFVREVYHQLLELKDESDEVKMSLQQLSEAAGSKNSMRMGSAMKLLGDIGLVERFDLPGQRIRGTRVLKKNVLPFQVELDEVALAEKERRDRSKLDAVVAYATGYGCRQQWMQRYFGEMDSERCGRCDECRSGGSANITALDEAQSTTLRKLLSGVARMSDRTADGIWEPRFGKGLVVKMLIGSEGQRIQNMGLNRLTTYGLLKDEGQARVSAILESALRAGYLVVQGLNRPMVTLTPLGDVVMRGRATPEMEWPKDAVPHAKALRSMRKGGDLKLGTEASEPADENLLNALKKKRLQLARVRGNVPPYVILSNRALEGLAEMQPSTPEEALDIPGIGPAKAKTIVPGFLKVIAAWQQASA